MLFKKGLIEPVNVPNKIWQENMLEKDARLFNCVRLYYFLVFVDEAPINGIATYFLHIIEGLSLDLTFTDLNQFLEFRRKMKNIDSICYSSIYRIEHLNEFKKTLTFQSRKKTIPLLSHMNDNMTVDDLELVNSLLEFHINSFLAFFTQRRLDKEF